MLDTYFNTELLNYGIKQYVNWDYSKYPNLLILGNTGAGKSYATRLLLARIAVQIQNSKLWICDYKNEFLSGENVTIETRYWGYKSVIDGLNSFRAEFEKRLNGGKNRDFCLLVIDEYISWLSSLDKKEAEEIKKQIATLLFMVRSLNMHVILGCQRGMAENFSYGSRDCLNVLFLGAPSKESIRSFASGEEAEQIKPCGQGAGYILFDEKPPKAITVPKINDMSKIEKTIITAATR